MNPFVLMVIFILFLLFLFLGLFYENPVFLIFAFACTIILIYELSNSGIEYPTGTNITITKLSDNVTSIGETDRYAKVTSFWTTPLIVIFSIIALGLIWQAVVGFEE